MTNTPPSPAPQEYQMVRITTQAHAKLKALAEAQKRSMSNQAEVLIEAEWAATQSNPPVAGVPRPFASANRQPAIPLGS